MNKAHLCIRRRSSIKFQYFFYSLIHGIYKWLVISCLNVRCTPILHYLIYDNLTYHINKCLLVIGNHRIFLLSKQVDKEEFLHFYMHHYHYQYCLHLENFPHNTNWFLYHFPHIRYSTIISIMLNMRSTK